MSTATVNLNRLALKAGRNARRDRDALAKLLTPGSDTYHRPFSNSTGSVKGHPFKRASHGYVTPFGQLPERFTDSVWEADYVIWSYQTPIAWHVPAAANPGRWIMPDVTYSVTTSMQQGEIRLALHYAGFPSPDPA